MIFRYYNSTGDIMSERKIHNFKSVILKERTVEEYGYDPDSLGKSSAKFVMATCRFCGEEHKIRKGFFNKSGSACHKECKIKEQSQLSPFKDPKKRAYALSKIEEKYGSKYASQNKEVAKKISDVKKSKSHQERVKKTNMDRYGVENVFQSEEIKEKIKQTSIEKYGVEHPLKSDTIKQAVRNTLLDRYGVSNMSHHKPFKDQASDTFKNNVKNDLSGKFDVINTLRLDAFWILLQQGLSLKEVCDSFNLSYQTVASTMSKDEFKDKFQALYSFPKTQTQNGIADIIAKLGVNVQRDTRKIISPLELDIYVPDRNFAIEYNGSYWHSECVLDSKRARSKHHDKYKKCKEQDIHLFHIFEHTWQEREKQIMGFIKSSLGANSRKIPARKCKITNTEQRRFMNDYHIQGYGIRTKQWFNLEYEGELVGSMTLSEHHRQGNENVAVLNRLCFKEDVTVQGGASKLFKQFKKWAEDNGYSKIVSWSDNSWAKGGVYEQLGFELVKEYGPDYFYYDVKNQKYVSKQSQQKKKTGCPDGMTEREWCIERGLYRIWDCGKKKWEIEL